MNGCSRTCDDIYVVSAPDRVGAIYAILQHELFTHAGIRVHGGKTQVWVSDQKPVMCWSRLPKQPTDTVSCGGGPMFQVCTRDQDLGGTVGPPGLCFRPSGADHCRTCCSVGADSAGAGRPVCMASVGPLCSGSGNLFAEGTATVALGGVRQIS